ncbi:MAG TPA: MotA/TolQ/ExbB proton channel family protein [Capsulimonadaceae bacterium]|jgi:biopolymer transport protein ExbB/TolQ
MPAQVAGRGLDMMLIVGHATIFGKLVFAILVFCSVLSIAVIIERYIVLRNARRAVESDLQKLDSFSQDKDYAGARKLIDGVNREIHPLLYVLGMGLSHWRDLTNSGEQRLDVKENMVNAAIVRELKLIRTMFRRRMPILANVASVAPFIGLFGTVTGIIATFDAISRSGNMGQDLVASGIAEALVATALGLFAAIPAVVGYNAFVDQVNNLILGMEEAALQRIYFLIKHEEA